MQTGKSLSDLETLYENFYAPAFAIEIDGDDIKRQQAEVAGVTVDNILGGAGQFSFSVNNPFDPGKNEFGWLDRGLFEVGKEVKIKMGYGKQMELMLLGIITSLKVSFPAGGASQIEVSGYDLSHKMMKGKKSPPAWNQKKDSDVVTEIARRYGFDTSKVEDTKISHPKIKQDKESDYDFIKKLADRNGFELFVFEKTLFFRPPAINTTPELALQWGKTLMSFSPEINIAEQVTEVKVIGWDPASKKEIIGKASKGQEESRGKGKQSGSEMAGKVYKDPVVEEVRKPVYSQAEADRLAKAILSRLSEGLVKGTGECIGAPTLKPGLTISLEGLGKRFSKPYYLDKTTHTIGTSGYKTSFSVKDNSL